ncbi:MAG: S8 family peptidase [Chloroflexota bacterium]
MQRLVGIGLALVLLLALAVPSLAEGPAPGRYIVYTADEGVNEAARKGVEGHGGMVLKPFVGRSGLVVLIPEAARGPVAGIPGVVAVEPDVVLSAVKPPGGGGGQPAESLPWGVNRIDADLAWGSVTGTGVDIAIIDTGIDQNHPDLVGNLAGGRNFVAKGSTVDPNAWNDDNGHGTHVAGTAAAVDNTIGVIGVAPTARLWAVKVLDRRGSGYLSDVIAGIYWAADSGMEVVNLSLGIKKETLDQYPNDRQALQDAVDYAYLTRGVVVVAAAGNEGAGTDTVIYPARFDSALAVAATDSNDARAPFSSTGPSVDLAAPGVSIYSTYKGGAYATMSGTSMASPHVAGAAALVIQSLGSAWSNSAVVNRLTSTADDKGAVGRDSLYGYGLVDAQQAATGVQTLP